MAGGHLTYITDRVMRCGIHGRRFVFFTNTWGVGRTRGCPVCVGEIREHVRREIDRHIRPLDLTDRARLFEGLATRGHEKPSVPR